MGPAISGSVFQAMSPPLDTRQGVCLFAHYAPGSGLSASVLHYLVQLRRCGLAIHMAISGVEQLAGADREMLDGIGVHAYPRENQGLDFGAWQHLIRIGCARDADFVVLANDSVFGPIAELPPIFAAMQAQSKHVWGMVESHEIDWHLQSWFICLNRAALNHPAIQRIFELPFAEMNKAEIILHGEIGLGTAIRSEGLSWAACLPDRRRGLRKLVAVNPMHVDWATVLACKRVPFIKVELLRDNPARIPWLADWPKRLREAGDFPDSWILERIAPQMTAPQTRWKTRLFYAALSRDRIPALRSLLSLT